MSFPQVGDWQDPAGADRVWHLENTDTVLINVHPIEACAGRPCCIHNRSEHHMRRWPQLYRADRGIMERTCPHGVGHPDPDDMAWRPEGHMEGVHGCDGCCVPSDRGGLSGVCTR